MRRLSAGMRLVGVLAFVSLLMAGVPRPARADDAADLMQLIVKVPTLQMAGKFDEALPLAQRAVALSEKVNGADNTITANCIGSLADVYKGKKQYAEAEAQYKRSVGILEKVDPLQSAMFLPTQLQSLGGIYIDLHRYPEALTVLQRAVTMREKSNDPSRLGMVLNDFAKAHFLQGNFAEAEPLYLRAIAQLEKAHGKDHLIIGPVANNLAMLYSAQGKYAAAEAQSRRALTLYEKNFGPENALVGSLWANHAEILRARGRYAEAEAMTKRALSVLEKALGPDAADVAFPVSNLGTLYHEQRRGSEAEPLLRRALTINQKTQGEDSPAVAKSLNNLATLLQDQGRTADAEPLLKRSLAIREKTLGADHPETALALNNLAVLYHSQKRYAEAQELLKRSLEITENRNGPNHPNVALALNNLAMMYQDEGRLDEVEPLMKRSLAIREMVLGRDHADVGNSLHNLAGLYQVQGRFTDAAPLYERSLAIFKKALGENHSMVGTSLNNNAELYYAQQDWAKAAALWEKSTALLIQRTKRGADSNGAVQAVNVRNEVEQENSRFWRLVKVSHRLGEAAPAQAAQISARMFETAQWAQSSQAAQSIAQMAARTASGDGALSKLVRERQDLVSEWQTHDKAVIAAASKETAKRVLKDEEASRERMAAIDTRLAAIDKTLARDFPDFASLTSSEPLSLAETQKLLKPDEALVLLLDTPDKAPLPEETFLWVVTKTDARWVRANIGTPAIKREVQALRCGLDGEDAWKDKKTCRELLGVEYSTEEFHAGKPMPFDVMRSYALYRSLFSGIREQIAGKRLLIVPSGALTQLPFQVLVTEAPDQSLSGLDIMRKAKWLIRDHAITVLPAVSSLKALRRTVKASTGDKAYLGIGNPLLDGRDSRYINLAAEARKRQSCPAEIPQQLADATVLRSLTSQVEMLDGRVNVEHLRMQCPLPETADELCAVAGGLKSAAEDVLLGAAATETNLKRMSVASALAHYRVLHFATHALMAGQIRADAEPGLILTPPQTATDEDDGYLSASEIAGLKLDADWVILSACNTAAGGADNAEALSGVARSFFYGGARSLAVSHWSVNSNATVRLVTSALAEMKADTTIAPAEALRRAMLGLIDNGKPWQSHPAFWAPFVIVGEVAK